MYNKLGGISHQQKNITKHSSHKISKICPVDVISSIAMQNWNIVVKLSLIFQCKVRNLSIYRQNGEDQCSSFFAIAVLRLIISHFSLPWPISGRKNISYPSFRIKFEIALTLPFLKKEK